MEQTFMTIHNLTPEANILFASESIFDILGYLPQEVLGRSSFDYFHPDEVPFARSVHSRGVLLDKAAVLHYARILSRDGRWISCECCFTIVHDVLVACISIYRRNEKSERRAVEAPQIRRLFSCSPRDPRYHMLEHLSPKFRMSPMEREPRAALILNRFTRTLTVMFATEAIGAILGVPASQVLHKSFYECIRESCLNDAIKCLESAKANDSIAYLRFWSRDPRRPEDFEDDESDNGVEDDDEDDDNEEDDSNSSSSDTPRMGSRVENGWNGRIWSPRRHHLPGSRRSSDSEGGGVMLHNPMDVDAPRQASPPIKTEPDLEMQDVAFSAPEPSSSQRRASAVQPSDPETTPSRGSTATWPSLTSTAHPESTSPRPTQNARRRRLAPSVELEAVVSCTSDGLVVILRRARPPIPDIRPPLVPFAFDNGLFAAPWGQQPIRPHYSPEILYNFRPPFLPQHMPLRENIKAAGGPPLDQLMNSIRDVAVFAWAVVGINGNLASYSRGQPMGESQPPDGLPIWDPSASQQSYFGPENQAARQWMNHQNYEGAVSGREPQAFNGFPERDLANADAMVSDNYSIGNGGQWPSQTLPQNSSWLYQHPPSYASNQSNGDHFVQQRMMRNGHLTTTFPPTPPSRWDEGNPSPGSHPSYSSSTEEPRRYPYPW